MAEQRATSGGFRWRIAIVEDHLLQRRATEAIIDRDPMLHLVWSGPTVKGLLGWLRDRASSDVPHLVTLDLMVDRGPRVVPRDVNALTALGIRVLVVSALSVPHVVQEVVRAGVDGVVSKQDPEPSIHAAIWTVLEGRSWRTPELAAILAPDEERPRLSDQEQRTLALYASGLTLDAVAEELNVRPNTAKKYLARVKAKYAAAGRPVSSKLELSRIAAEHGYVDP